MGDGWYKGRFGLNRINKKNLFGEEYKLCLHIIIEYIAKYDINRFEYKIFDVYFSLNGLERKHDPKINF